MNDNRYDVIVIESGPGGGSVSHSLARTGKRILFMERGDYLGARATFRAARPES
jgi:choline dehydrogenase-like flavoprotein